MGAFQLSAIVNGMAVDECGNLCASVYTGSTPQRGAVGPKQHTLRSAGRHRQAALPASGAARPPVLATKLTR